MHLSESIFSHLIHCILNRLSHTIYWKSPISILSTSGYEIYIFLEKKDKQYANSGNPDQTRRSAASDLGLHCLSITLLRVSRLQWVSDSIKMQIPSVDASVVKNGKLYYIYSIVSFWLLLLFVCLFVFVNCFSLDR